MLYKLNETNRKEYEKVKRTTLAEIKWKEKDLEDLLSNNIKDLISLNDLMPIFTERQMQEEPDILALDKDGDLYIFELKRWESNKENLLQVLRYGQLFGRSTYDDLNELYKKYQQKSQSLNIGFFDDNTLFDAHKKYFEKSDNTATRKEDFNKEQHFLIVTNGLDQETVESILYWKNKGLKIDAIIYWVFDIKGEKYIEFNTYSQVEDYLEYENNCYLLNTNKSNNPKQTEEMLEEEKAAAYYPGWRDKIARLQKGDRVFLYENGVGIRAYGIASGILNKKECDGKTDYEYNMKLNDFVKLKEPVSASEMKSVTGVGFNFRQTLVSISEEAADKLIDYIKKKNEKSQSA